MNRLIKKSERNGKDWFAYHSTPAENIDSIKQNGLLANSKYLDGPNLSLGGTYEGAKEWGHLRGSKNGFVVVKVKLTEYDIEEIKIFTEEWEEFYTSRMIEEFKKLGYETDDLVNGEETIEDFIADAIEYGSDTEEFYNNLEQDALEEFFDSYELNMRSDISASQIVSISEVIM